MFIVAMGRTIPALVHIGPFATYELAEQAANRQRTRTRVPVWVIELEPPKRKLIFGKETP